MERFVRIHYRGAPSGQLRLETSFFAAPRLRTFSIPFSTSPLLRQRPFTWQSRALNSSPLRSSFKRIPPSRFVVGISAAAAIPIVAQNLEDDVCEKQEDNLTLEQRLLDTSEGERRQQTYGANRELSVIYRFCKNIKILFLRYIYEPIATGLRFIHIVVIFVPVILTIPLVYIGARDPERDNERSGTLWWYSFLVRQMERAGATFIKAFPHHLHV